MGIFGSAACRLPPRSFWDWDFAFRQEGSAGGSVCLGSGSREQGRTSRSHASQILVRSLVLGTIRDLESYRFRASFLDFMLRILGFKLKSSQGKQSWLIRGQRDWDFAFRRCPAELILSDLR